MIAVTEKVAAEHWEVVDSEGSATGRCYCGDLGQGYRRGLSRHVAEETEAAVREHIATELEALEDNPLLKGLVAINGGALAMLEYALATARGKS